MLTSEVAVLRSRHGISVKCSRHRDTGPTDPSLHSIVPNNLSLPLCWEYWEKILIPNDVVISAGTS